MAENTNPTPASTYLTGGGGDTHGSPVAAAQQDVGKTVKSAGKKVGKTLSGAFSGVTDAIAGATGKVVGTVEATQEKADDSVFSTRQQEILRELAGNHSLSSKERNELYAELVSDNYGENKTERYNDGTMVDVSEMTMLEKTKLSDGEFRTTGADGVRFDDFDNVEAVDGKKTKEVCGGTITYKGKGSITQPKNSSGFGDLWTGTYFAITDEQRGDIVEYNGVLGHFEYNTRFFELSYYETEQNGNKVSVPVLHYKGDEHVGVFFGSDNYITNGSKITIPEGLEIADYMFAGTSIETMPDISECSTLKSAHCMFMNCKSLTKGCDDSLTENGQLKFPAGLMDASWMFAGCDKMSQFFGKLGERVIDMRCCAQDCSEMGYTADGFTFQFPDMGAARHLVQSYCDDMLDNANTEVAAATQKYCEANGLAEDGVLHISKWTDKDGSGNCIFKKVEDGSYDKELIDMIQKQADKRGIVQLIDPEAKGKTGLSAITAGMMDTATHLKDEGDAHNGTTWATVLQSDKTFHFEDENSGGELLDRAAMFGGTYGLVRGVTKSKLLGLGVAVAGQFTGFASHLTPVLDTVAGFVGKDSGIGKFISGISDKLKSSNVEYHTKVEELNLDKVFDEQQGFSTQYAYQQMRDVLIPRDAAVLPDPDGHIAGTSYDVSAQMRENGRLIADAGNLLILGMTPESEIESALDGKLMDVAMAGVMGNLDEDVGSKPITDELRDEYSGYFRVLMYNMKAYSDGAKEVVSEKYIGDEHGEAVANAGLDKVMRSTCKSMYEAMATAQKDYNLFTAEQIAELDSMAPAGMSKFSEYTLGQDLCPEGDKYADEFKNHQKTFREALEAAKSEEDVNKAYKAYYEGAYGSVIREAERQGVVLDTKGAEVEGTDSAKLSSQIGKAAMTAEERIKAAEAISPGAGNDGSEKEASLGS